MTASIPCAICGDPVFADDDHVRVVVELNRVDDVNEETEYYLHPRCARGATGGWTEP